MTEELVSVRYMVDDVHEAIDFHIGQFGFVARSSALPAFADVVRGRLRLLLAGPESSAGRPMPDVANLDPATAGTGSTSSSRRSPLRSRARRVPASALATRS